MSWILNGTTLPRPQDVIPGTIETKAEHMTASGRSIKQVTNRKNKWTLMYEHLTQAEVATIKGLLDLDTVMAFSASDGSYTISETNVIMDISSTEAFSAKGSSFRENLYITLTEEI